MNNKLVLPIAIIIAGILIAGTVFYVNSSSNKIEGLITAEEATTKVISFINENVLQGQGTANATETLDESGIYKIKFEVEGESVEWRVTKDGKLLFPQTISIDDFSSDPGEPANDLTLGNFEVTKNEVCSENGTPIIYFFGSETCPHCQWEHPIMQKVVAKFNGYISFHDNMDSEKDSEIFSEYSKDGYVPATLIGCKYFRVGSGENIGEEEDAKNLTALICSLTDGQPGAVCDEVQELIDNI